MFLIVLTGKQLPDLMPNLNAMNKIEHKLLKQHMSCLPDVLKRLKASLPNGYTKDIVHLSNTVITHIEQIEQDAAATAKKDAAAAYVEAAVAAEKQKKVKKKMSTSSIASSQPYSEPSSATRVLSAALSSSKKRQRSLPPASAAPSSITSLSSSSSNQGSNKYARVHSSSKSRQRFPTNRQKERANKNRPTYTNMDGTQHSQSSQLEGEEEEEGKLFKSERCSAKCNL